MGNIIKAFLFLAGIGVIITIVWYVLQVGDVITSVAAAVSFGPYTILFALAVPIIAFIGVWRLING